MRVVVERQVTRVTRIAPNRVQVIQRPLRTIVKAGMIAVGGGSQTYHYEQLEPASVWTIPHGLGYYPNVRFKDTGGNEFLGDIVDVNEYLMTVDFGVAFSGTADLS